MEHTLIEIRSVATSERLVTVRVAPYRETSYLTSNPAGERFQPGAFERGLRGRERKIKLLRGHDQRGNVYGISRRFTDTPDGLIGEFEIRTGPDGDRMLDDLRSGYLDVSAGFIVERSTRGPNGVRLIEQARLYEVSAVAIGAYEDAQVLAVRHAQTPGPARRREPWETPRRWPA